MSTKLHLACDGRGRPLGFVLSGGNTNDCTRLEAVLEHIRVPRVGAGRPRPPPRPRVPPNGDTPPPNPAPPRRRGIPHTQTQRR
ncbi:transposase, partial [Kitasatospora purpeofusca]|uniref:transposase n=1 Tax=Kitasatospora purpeofusca TaxID=67352 RepID=UPI0035DEB6FF